MYKYEDLKPLLFTEDNQLLFIKIRENVHRMLNSSGAFTMGHVASLPTGIGAADTWTMLACVDRLLELGEIKEIPTHGAVQNRLFIEGNR